MEPNYIGRKLMIHFRFINEEGKDTSKVKTITNLRDTATEAEISQFAGKFADLSANPCQRIVLAYYHALD